jgi:hypothetical protein
MTTGSGYRYLGGSSVWFPLIALFGLGLLVGILLKWWAQKTRVYSGTLFKLCHRPRSNDLVWIAAFNQCTAQLPSTYGPEILPSLLYLLHPHHTPAGSILTVTSSDRRSTIADHRDAWKFSFHLPSCSLCPEIPPPDMGGIVWHDGCYNFALCLHDERVPGEFAHRFAQACGSSLPAEASVSSPVSAASPVAQRDASSRASSPPMPADRGVNPPRSSLRVSGHTNANARPLLPPSPSPSPSPTSRSSPIHIPSSPDSDSDAPSPANNSNWQIPSWAKPAAVEQAARAQEVATALFSSSWLSHAVCRVRG